MTADLVLIDDPAPHVRRLHRHPCQMGSGTLNIVQMFVCSCRAVTDRTIDAAIASGAASVRDVAERCGAGSRCGGCWPELQRLLGEHDAQRACADQAVA